jgi:hypothetical protein
MNDKTGPAWDDLGPFLRLIVDQDEFTRTKPEDRMRLILDRIFRVGESMGKTTHEIVRDLGHA